MSRGLTAGMLTQANATRLQPVLLYEGEFQSGTVRLWTGVGPLTWNSVVWTGAGTLLGITPIEETRDTRAVGIAVTLSGISSTIIAVALTECRLKKAGSIYFACMSGGAIVADPVLAYKGFLDIPTIEDQGDTCTVTISYESELIDLQRPRIRRYTHNDQKLDYANDKGFEYVSEIQERDVLWGGNPVSLQLPLRPPPPPPGPYVQPYNPYNPNNGSIGAQQQSSGVGTKLPPPYGY